MSFWRIVALGGLLTVIAPCSQGQDGRFSKTLTASEQTDAGLGRLSADQLAVLDALIRRDEKINVTPDAAHPAPARFSQRLSPEERASSGLASLSQAELTRLDALVQRRSSGNVSSVVSSAARPALQPEPSAPAPEIHGMISFTFGGGRGGYREKGGFMMLDYQDPAHGLDLLVGYGESRISGPSIGRGCYGWSPRWR
jgi:hypothetical protein